MFSGRINRKTFWVAMAGWVAIIAVLISLGLKPTSIEVATVLIGVPRLHDIGKRGWWVVAPIATEFAIVIGADIAGMSLEIAAGLAILLMIGFVGWLGSRPGELHENRWGPPPAAGFSFSKPAKP